MVFHVMQSNINSYNCIILEDEYDVVYNYSFCASEHWAWNSYTIIVIVTYQFN
jgi:hypothetical protein